MPAITTAAAADSWNYYSLWSEGIDAPIMVGRKDTFVIILLRLVIDLQLG